MKKMTGLIAILALVCFVSLAHAQVQPGRFSVTPGVGGYIFDGGQNLKPAVNFGLGLGYDYSERIGVEGMLNYVNNAKQEHDAGNLNFYGPYSLFTNTALDLNPLGKASMYKYNYYNEKPNANAYLGHIDLIYNLMPKNKLVPYLAVGLGVMGVDYNDTNTPLYKAPDTYTTGLFNYGGGVKYFVNDAIALRGDVRHIIGFDRLRSNVAYMAGLSFFFGGKKQTPPPPPPAPKPEPVVETPKPTPPPPAPEPKCKNVPADVAVDADGCPIKESLSIDLRLEFDFDKAAIRPKYHDHIKEVADFMNLYTDTTCEIEGHTDSVGTDEYNQKLSQRRADAVRTYLIEKFSVQGSRLTAKGYGESKPIATNATSEGRQKNRRVVGTIITVKIKKKSK